jgi:hypothetical protein
MFRPLAFGAATLLICQCAVAAEKPAVRGSIRLPVSAHRLAEALGLASSDASTLLLSVVRLVYEPKAQDPQGRRVRDALAEVLSERSDPTTDVVPLPLDPAIWRDTLLQTPISPEGDGRLVSAILSDRRAALLYFGLSALDDETLAWLESDRDTLLHARKHAAIFAAFGRSVHVRGRRMVVPGGTEAESLWKSLTAADPGNPGAFVQRLISGDGRLAFMYDTIAHLDGPRQRFALGLGAEPSLRADRLRSLLESFVAAAPDWRPDERPFSRPPIDGAILLSTIEVMPNGAGAAPLSQSIWERVFRADELTDVAFEKVSDAGILQEPESRSVDAAWLATRILRAPYTLGRRRLDTLLFAQRVFGGQPPSDGARIATALRGYVAFPALMISLERSGMTAPDLFVRAAEHAAQLNAIDSLSLRRTSIAEFQSAVALIERARRTGALNELRAEALVSSLSLLEVSPRTAYHTGFSRWLRDQFIGSLTARPSAEETVLTAIAGVARSPEALPIVEWEGRQYRVDPASAELRRLRLVRESQGGSRLDEALSAAFDRGTDRAGLEAEHALADTLTTIVYAAYLGDPDGPAVTSGNVALRHDFGIVTSPAKSSAGAWRLPVEHFDGKAAWHIRGSIMGLEAALGRLALRRIDPATMPGEPKLGSQDRQTLILTITLLSPFAMSDVARDDIAAAIARGRGRAAALSQDPSKVEDLARAAGLSEWRREALAWTLARDGPEVVSQFSLLELFWMGFPGTDVARAIDAWGAAVLPLTGCLCLEMPRPGAWEDFGGRASAMLGTRGADVALQIAETLAALELPASLSPAIGGYAMQDVIEHAELAYTDDWEEFGRAARELPRDRMFDYIAALTAGGPLVPVEGSR